MNTCSGPCSRRSRYGRSAYPQAFSESPDGPCCCLSAHRQYRCPPAQGPHGFLCKPDRWPAGSGCCCSQSLPHPLWITGHRCRSCKSFGAWETSSRFLVSQPRLVVAKSAQLRFRLRRKLRSLPCSSSPHQNCFAGFWRGPRPGSGKIIAPGPQNTQGCQAPAR